MDQIIDTHTHFFDPHRPQGVPWPPSDNPDLYRTTLPEHFLEAAASHGVTHTVVVEASSWLEDNQWILDLADDAELTGHTAIAGFVGNLRNDDADFRRHLDRFRVHPLFRGIRLGNDALTGRGRAMLVDTVRELAARELTLDVVPGAPELPALIDLCDAVPEAHVVIDHVGQVPIDGSAPDPAWCDGMAVLARAPHVYCKISGLVENAVTKPSPADVRFYEPTLDALWERFGAERLLYASNWPVCRRGGPYATVFALAQGYVERHGAEAQSRVFRENAIAAYRLPAPRS